MDKQQQQISRGFEPLRQWWGIYVLIAAGFIATQINNNGFIDGVVWAAMSLLPGAILSPFLLLPLAHWKKIKLKFRHLFNSAAVLGFVVNMTIHSVK